MEFYYYNIDSDTTIESLVTDPLSVFREFRGQTGELLKYESDGKSNFHRVIDQYSSDELESEKSRIFSRDLSLVKSGTVLLLPKGDLKVDLVALTGRNLFVKDSSSFTAFYGSYLDLLKRDDYTPYFKIRDSRDEVHIKQYHISLWVWSRSYSRNGNILLDLSKFVESCTTTVNGTQNSFNISLQPIEKVDIEVGDELFSRVDLNRDEIYVPWFKKILQQNDIFFIRFERLVMERSEDRINRGLEVSASALPGKVFDMIGLVDEVGSSFKAETTEVSVSVSGRDLTKLLIEDGSYFFPLLFTENADTLFFNTQDDSKWFKRNFVKSTFENLFTYKMQSIRDSLGFMVNQLSNLGVCNDELFSSYRDRRTQSIRLTGEKKDIVEWNVVSGIWQIIDFMVDDQIDDRRIANSQIANPNGNLMGVVDSFCQKPFVEFYGDTYGDKYVFVARQFPYTKEAILSVLNSGYYIDIDLRSVEDADFHWESNFYTWFEMDPRNMFLGRSESVALAYLPIVYFPEIAEAFGNRRMTVVDNYISNKALTGIEGTESRDEFKQKVIEDFLYIIESYCYLPFTESGTITLKRDRRIKAKTWIKLGDRFFYIESVSNSFMSMGEKVDGATTIHVSHGMKIDYIRGKMVEELGRVVDYWSMVRLSMIREVLIKKLIIADDEDQNAQVAVTRNTVKASFGTDREVFDYFLQRRHL